MPRIRNPKWIILIIFSGFIARVLWWSYAEPIPVSDFETYRHLAEGLVKNCQFGIPNPSAFRLPGYPVFLALMLVINKSIAWLSFSSVFLSTLLIYITYKLSFHLTREKFLSLIAACVCAFNPTFIFFSPLLASEHLFAILLFLAFLVITDNRTDLSTNRVEKLILAGILFGAATLTRGDGLFFLPILLMMMYFTSGKNIRRCSAVFVSLLAFGITIAPWCIRNYYVVGPGSGLSTAGGINFYYAHNENQYGWHSLKGTVFNGKNEIQIQKLGYQLGCEYLSKAGISRIAKDVAGGTKRLFFSSENYSVKFSIMLPRSEPGKARPSKQLKGVYWFKKLAGIYFVLLMPAILSLLFLRQYKMRVWIFLYGIVAMNWIGHAWIFWGKARYRYVSEVIFCILFALFICETIKYVQGVRRRFL